MWVRMPVVTYAALPLDAMCARAGHSIYERAHLRKGEGGRKEELDLLSVLPVKFACWQDLLGRLRDGIKAMSCEIID